MKAGYLTPSEVFAIEDSCIWVDVRSPGEYAKGHLPGAISLPLLDNDQRAEVGTCYKQMGQKAAIRLGFHLVGPSLSAIIQQVDDWDTSKTLVLYCWRGGMRSESMAWLLRTAGFKVYVVSGGYKAMRKALLDYLFRPFGFILVSGYTGSGKSKWLQYLQEAGEQVVDLEALASHKGSAFGALGMPAQPTQEQFENLLANTLRKMKITKPVWIEHESRTIGRCCIPEAIYARLMVSPLIFVSVPLQRRVQQLVSEYAVYSKEQLAASICRIAKKLGPQETKEALSALEHSSYDTVAALALRYYDKCYMHDVHQHSSKQQIHWDAGSKSHFEIAEHIKKLQQSFYHP
jgi:tRNA 2-selenouridine synthase